MFPVTAADGADADYPTIARGEGAGWDVAEELTAEALGRDGDTVLMAEIDGSDDQPVTMSDALAALVAGTRSLYVRSLVVETWRPDLARLLPAHITELNWLNVLPAAARPKWLWVMLGVQGTKTGTHIDTLYSAAWNLLITGRKQWTFRSPAWSCQRGYIPALPAELTAAAEDEIYQVEQLPGDVIYTPTGWAHEVYNVESSISITGNYLNASNMRPAIHMLTASGKHDVARLLTWVAENRQALADTPSI